MATDTEALMTQLDVLEGKKEEGHWHLGDGQDTEHSNPKQHSCEPMLAQVKSKRTYNKK